MIEGIPYKKWQHEEPFGHLLFQYDLTKSDPDDCTTIPFQIVEWITYEYGYEMWNEDNTQVTVLMSGDIIFEGVRHCYFGKYDEGYVNYPDILNLSKCLHRIHELCLKYCHSYNYFDGDNYIVNQGVIC